MDMFNSLQKVINVLEGAKPKCKNVAVGIILAHTVKVIAIRILNVLEILYAVEITADQSSFGVAPIAAQLKVCNTWAFILSSP